MVLQLLAPSKWTLLCISERCTLKTTLDSYSVYEIIKNDRMTTLYVLWNSGQSLSIFGVFVVLLLFLFDHKNILLNALKYYCHKLFLASQQPSTSTSTAATVDIKRSSDSESQEEINESSGKPQTAGDSCPDVLFVHYRLSDIEMLQRSESFYNRMRQRRSLRAFSPDSFPLQVIENIIRTAGTSPSGAHTEPWTYVVVASKDLKEKIRRIVEEEEEINYKRRMGDTWVHDLQGLKTNWIKPYLTTAPYLIILLRQCYGTWPNGEIRKHYYNEISVAISAGLLLAAIQNSGLVTVTSTPLNTGPAIRQLLGRPSNEKVVLLLPVGFPAQNAMVPDLKRKRLDEFMKIF